MNPIWRLAAALVSLAAAAPALCDEAIDRVDNEESFSLAIAPLHAQELGQPMQGAPVANTLAGTRYLLGYEVARTRSLFGIAGWYTDLDLSIGAGTLRYRGSVMNAPAGAPVGVDEVVTYGQEAMRLRLGRSFEFARGEGMALTPFVGLLQQSWTRESPSAQVARAYAHDGLEAGALFQASLPWSSVLAASASLGRTLGVAESSDSGSYVFAKASSFALKLDHRTFPDWHQSVEVRQDFLRYAPSSSAAATFAPRRTSSLAFMLEMGVEIPAR